ncbi:hypothetical protein BJ165DRAFT_1529729 [Panaeolus papilionaceus]|nr:hypothetical protein BJ165DRAFT_1529729 [Panaeolus papilionaceus]
MDPFAIMIDGADPLIFSSGSWMQESGDFPYNKTWSYTSFMGSTKIVCFFGSSITVWGWLQSYTNTPNALPVSQYAMHEAYYQSPELPMGEHVLTIKNMVDHDIIYFD